MCIRDRSCAKCWVRARRGSGETASPSWFRSFISRLHAERTPIGSAEANFRCPARNPSQDHEAEPAAGRAENQLLTPRADRRVPRVGQKPAAGLCRTACCLVSCLLYTSDAADEEDSVDLGGRRFI